LPIRFFYEDVHGLETTPYPFLKATENTALLTLWYTHCRGYAEAGGSAKSPSGNRSMRGEGTVSIRKGTGSHAHAWTCATQGVTTREQLSVHLTHSTTLTIIEEKQHAKNSTTGVHEPPFRPHVLCGSGSARRYRHPSVPCGSTRGPNRRGQW